MKELVWIIIILSTFYILNFAIEYYNHDEIKTNKSVLEVENKPGPHDILTPKVIPHSDLNHPDLLPVDKLVEPEPKKVVILDNIQSEIIKPFKCDITIGANRPQFKNEFEANYNDSGADINMITMNNPVLTGIKTMSNNDTNVLMSYNDDLYQNSYEDIDTTPQLVINKPVIKPKNVPSNISFNNKNYDFIGVAYNEYYDQYYLLYENVVLPSSIQLAEDNLSNINYKIAEYILAKMDDNKGLIISHIVGPRNKINYNEVVYFSFGNFQLGPLLVKQV